MDMTPQTAWLIAISAVVLVGVVAFFIGRSTAGTKARIDELEAELRSKKAEVEGYRKEVEQHLDKTATLFVSMAGSYKALFEHLSGGYEKLATGSAREIFQQRVDALLLGGAREDKGSLLGGGAAVTATAAAAAAGAAEAVEPPVVDAPSGFAPGERVASVAEPSFPEAEAGVNAPGAAALEDDNAVWKYATKPDTARVPPAGADAAAAEAASVDADAIMRRAEGGGFDPDGAASTTPGGRPDER